MPSVILPEPWRLYPWLGPPSRARPPGRESLITSCKRDANLHNPYMDKLEIGAFSYKILENTRFYHNIKNNFGKCKNLHGMTSDNLEHGYENFEYKARWYGHFWMCTWSRASISQNKRYDNEYVAWGFTTLFVSIYSFSRIIGWIIRIMEG